MEKITQSNFISQYIRKQAYIHVYLIFWDLCDFQIYHDIDISEINQVDSSSELLNSIYVRIYMYVQTSSSLLSY